MNTSDLKSPGLLTEKKFDITLSSIGDAVISTDDQGRITFMNQVAESLTGWNLTEAFNRFSSEIFNVINEYTEERTKNPIEEVIQTGKIIALANHTLLIRKDGQKIPIDDSAAPIRTDEGKLIGVVLVFRDISERKRAERMLLESQERLKKSQEIAHLGSWELDLITNTLIWSDEIYQIFGLAPKEFQATYDAFLNAVHPEDRSLVDNAYTNSLKNGDDEYEVEHRIIRKDSGEIRFVHEKCHHQRNVAGQVIQSIGMVHDITERKRAELALKESEKQVRKKLESILHPDGNVDNLELEDIINTDEIQSMMDFLFDLTSIPMAIIDNKGKVLVGVGWQTICTHFHRVHPVTCKNCMESDLQLTSGIPEGEFKLYKCANGMWDIATPLNIGGQHKGNLFMGQFFFDDEEINLEIFKRKAAQYGFNQEEYLNALKQVNRISRTKLEKAKGFYLKFANKISKLSYSNIKLARSIHQLDLVHQELKHKNERLDILSETAGLLLASANPQKEVEELCSRVMRYLECDIFVNYLFDENKGILHLNAAKGIPAERVPSLKWLKIGVAVCGVVAQQGKRILEEEIQQKENPRTELVKSLGIQSYCCHPLLGKGEVLGTLSFGRKAQKKFTAEDLSMMKMVADFVALAMDRIKSERALMESEKKANQKAEEIQKMMNIVPSAIWVARDAKCHEITGNDTANKLYETGEGVNVSPSSEIGPLRRYFKDGKELSPEEFPMHVAANTGSEIRNIELEVVLPSGKSKVLLGNASPLKDEKGSVRGCVGAFLDITERKKAEKEGQLMLDLLHISNQSQNAKEFIHSSLNFFLILTNFDAIGLRLKDGEDYPYYETKGFSGNFVRSEQFLCARDHKGNVLIDGNSKPVFECLCGQVIKGQIRNENTLFTHFGSCWSNSTSEFNISQLEKDLNCRIRNRCNKEGYESIALIPLKLGSENIGLLQLNCKEKGVITSEMIDLVERLSGPFSIALARFLAEEELQQKEEKLLEHADMLEHAPVLVRNIQGEITIWNSGMEKLYGFNRKEALGKIEKDLLRTEFPKPVSQIMNELFTANQWEGELIHRRKDGSIIEVLSLWTLHKDQEGNAIAVIEVNNDITNRKKKEAELYKLNRVLNAKERSSQVMIHSLNESHYLNEVCKILVEDCSHSLVWIGYGRNDDQKTIQPVAFYGFDSQYVRNLKLSWAENDFGNGPAGKAIRTGKPVICRNILSDPDYQPWRKDAMLRGYMSSIALPLVLEDNSFGVLSIYSKSIDSFSSDEVNLLSSLAEDLTFGIGTLRLKESENKALSLLTESEEKYRTLFNEMTEGFSYQYLITDEAGNPRDYRFLNVNPAFEKHTGLKAHEVVGKTASEIYSNDTIYWIGMYAEVALQGKSREFEIYNSTLDRFFKVSVFSNQKNYFAVIFENITERVLAEKELQSTKNYLENLINKANAPIIVWNPALEIQLFNRAFQHLTGYQSEEVVGKNLEILFPKSSLKDIKIKIQQANIINWESIEIPILTKSKEIRTVLWNSANIYDSDSNNLISVIAQGNDITERKKAEHKLKVAQETLNLALDNGNIGTWERVLQSNLLIWDKRMEKMFGFQEGCFDGKYETFERCLLEEDLPFVREEFRKAIEENTPYETVFRITSKNGELSYINAKALVIKDSEGKPIRMSGVCFDVTDMKKGAERILIKLNEDLHRSNKELEQFAYVASHDLQEPLRMVASFTQLLARRYNDKLDEEGKEFIHFAVEGAVRMQRLINDLLNYSRIGTRGQKFLPVDFNEVLNKTLFNLKVIIGEKKAQITSDNLPLVKGDEIQMVQLLQNLIGNALKFCDVQPIIHISAQEQGNYCLFSVRDNGIGIEKQYFDKIFLIFQRLLPKDQYEGTGIGLAICKRIIERHGGKIWVSSAPGDGTTFYFTLLKI